MSLMTFSCAKKLYLKYLRFSSAISEMTFKIFVGVFLYKTIPGLIFGMILDYFYYKTSIA